jgi:hypothetical protein
MFSSDHKQDGALAPRFATVELPPTKAAAFPARVLLSAGDIARATACRPPANS